ncbi:MAG: hypothetical protein IH983_13330 [Planctomycetes bacterium]|nr:hypothetical protein [Planctomycetota bacterium]
MIQLKGGETFLIPEPGSSLDSHLWIVLSEPSIDPENVLIVNLTTWAEYKDQACLLQPGDHPFVKQRTCVNYADAKVVTAHQLETFLDRGQIEHQTPLTSSFFGGFEKVQRSQHAWHLHTHKSCLIRN